MSQIKEEKKKLNQFHKVFQNSMAYPNSMIWGDRVQFFSTQWDDIEPAINKVLEYIETYRYNNEFQDYGDYRKKIEVYAVACLPFLLAKFKIENPKIEDRRFKEATLNWLTYIKHNKIIAGHLLREITSGDSIVYIQDESLVKQIGIFQWFVDGAKKTTKKHFWSHVIQFLYLADTVDKLWRSQELDKKIDFLYQLFSIFQKDSEQPEIKHSAIKKRMILEARKTLCINVSDEHISKVLSQPNNKLTKQEIRDHYHFDLSKDLLR